MRFLTKFYTAILVIVISIVFMIMFVVKDLVLMMDDNTNFEYIPKEAVFVARINTSELIKSSASELLTTQDPEIKEQMQKLDLKSGKRTFNGINFSSNVYMFILPFEGEFVEGFLFNITDKTLFQEYYQSQKKYIFSSNDEVGVVFLRDLESFTEQARKKLSTTADQLIQKPQNNESQIGFSNSEAIISTWSSDVSAGLPFSNKLDLSFESDKILLKGTLTSETDLSHGWNYLERKGISFNTSFIPENINDSINKLLKNNDDRITIESISLNYSGVNFEQTTKLSIVPEMEVLLDFTSNVNQDTLLNRLHREKYIQLSDSSGFTFNEVAFSVAQPQGDQLLIYSGNAPSPIEVRNELLEFSGDPSLLFKVGGNSPYGQFLNFIPLFRSGRQLTDATETINLKVTPGKNGTHQVNGVLLFKKDRSPILELIKFMNNAALLK